MVWRLYVRLHSAKPVLIRGTVAEVDARSYLQFADSAAGEDAESVVGAKTLTVTLPFEGRRRFAECRAGHVASLHRPYVPLRLVIVRKPRLV